MRRLLKRLLTPPLYALAALVILFEDLLWDPLRHVVGGLVRRLHLARLEAWIAGLAPYPSLALFAVPVGSLFPVKLTALWLLAGGHIILGASVLIGAKVLGTALAAWLFGLCKPKLLTLGWFARAYDWVTRLRVRTLAWLRATAVWRGIGALRARLATGRESFLRRRWRSIRALLRRG